MKVLVITIGGAYQPIVKSIKLNKPDFVYFICSHDTGNAKGSYNMVNGEGKVCGGNPKQKRPHDKPNILVLTGLDSDKDKFEIIKINNPDYINECFLESNTILKTCTEENSGYNDVIIDYTGGTKSMSAGLILAASNYPDVTISLVAGLRNDLIKTVDGTEYVKLFKVNNAYLINYLSKAELLLRNRDYGAVISILENLFSNYTDIPEDISKRANEMISKARAFNYWDKFEHIEAYNSLRLYKQESTYKNYLVSLGKIIVARSKMDKGFDLSDTGLKNTMPVTGYEIVYDLILNAERKEENKYYDDAVARIYRAIELFIQVHLKLNYGIETSNIDIAKIPDGELKEEWNNAETHPIKIGLDQSYQLLGYMNNEDPVYLLYENNKNHLLSVLEARNNSILAHGFSPINEAEYKKIKKHAIIDFIMKLIDQPLKEAKFNLPQFSDIF